MKTDFLGSAKRNAAEAAAHGLQMALGKHRAGIKHLLKMRNGKVQSLCVLLSLWAKPWARLTCTGKC